MEEIKIADNITKVRDEKIPYYYVNGVTVSASTYDFQLICSNTVLESQTKTIYKRDLCDIIMSPEHVKVLYKILGEIISNYEADLGEIKTQPNKNIISEVE